MRRLSVQLNRLDLCWAWVGLRLGLSLKWELDGFGLILSRVWNRIWFCVSLGGKGGPSLPSSFLQV